MTLLLLFSGEGEPAPPSTGLASGQAKLGLQVFEDATESVMIADWTSRATPPIIETGPHGYASLSTTVPMTPDESFRFYDMTPAAHVVLGDGAFHVFKGRIEDRPLSPDSFGFTAFGYWAAFRDAPYTALWSTQDISKWRTMTGEDQAGQTPEKYVMRLKDGLMLYTSLRHDEAYAQGTDVGAWLFEAPDDTEKDLAHITFDYDLTLPTGWSLRTVSRTWDLGTSTVEDTVAGNGSNQTGSKTITLTADRQAIELQIYNASAADPYTNALESDDWFCKITAIRIKASTAASITADLVADDLVSFMTTFNTGNATQLSSSTALINSPAVDLTEMSFEDDIPADILTELAERGDDSSPAEVYEVGVWEGQQLHFRQQGSQAQEWYIDLGDFRIDSTLDTMYNEVYATYRRVDGLTLRSDMATDSASVSKYNIKRRKQAASRLEFYFPAADYRNAVLEETKDITPRARIVTDKIYTSSGALAPIYLCRAGDNCTIRNLPVTGGSAVDKIRRFRIHRTRLDCDTGLLEITPELEPPSLVDLVAANTKAIGV